MVWDNLLQSILYLSIPKANGNQLWPTSKKCFFCSKLALPFLFLELRLGTFGQSPRMSSCYLIFCYLGTYVIVPKMICQVLSSHSSSTANIFNHNHSWLMLVTQRQHIHTKKNGVTWMLTGSQIPILQVYFIYLSTKFQKI